IKKHKEVLFGIRPEDMEVLPTASGADIEAVVKVVEPLGAQTQLHVDIGGHGRTITTADATDDDDNATIGGSRLTAVTGPEDKYQIGDKIYLKVNLNKAHFFDMKTEASLFYKGEYSADKYRAAAHKD
ncbi:MAG: TOBE domain-containing protein, partial [Spirochaetaceae bacterium]|nr:TOBE domain-containing protein [Spirochaetaceae bacterium]